MRKLNTSRPVLRLRAAALLLAFVCLWISGGAVLSHTDADDTLTVQTYAAGHSALHHALPAPPPVPCAACQWEQTLPALPAPAPSVAALPLCRFSFAAALPPVLHLRPANTATRGPPSPLS